MSPSITRVGIVAKRGLRAASEHLDQLARWLRERHIEAVFETETAALAGAGAGGTSRSRDDVPRDVDLVIVLGGDGTLLSMATRIALAGRDIPILGVNFGSLGFLTEIRIDELYTALESVMAGTATLDQRAMLAADAYRSREHFDSRIVLNDVVFTKAALSRIIELSISVRTGHQGEGRRTDYRERHRVHRLQSCRRRSDHPSARRRDRDHADRAAHAHQPAHCDPGQRGDRDSPASRDVG
jgi:NAD+ kinase